MSRLTRLMRALDPRALERNADRVDSLNASTRALRQELRTIREGLSGLTTQLGAIQGQMEQLAALRREELDTTASLDRLERLLDAEGLHGHARAAVARAEIVEQPVPHARISGLLPPDVYDAAIDAIPSSIFFETSAAHGRELRVPPRLAPTYSIATWTYLAEMVNTVLGPALVGRFQGLLDRHLRTLAPSLPATGDDGMVFAVGSGRIVLRRPGVDAPNSRTRPWHFLTTIVDLARTDDSADYGSVLSPLESAASGAATTIPFRANSALTVFNPLAAHEYVSIPHTAPGDTVRYTYEFRIGPDTETRRRLLSVMDQATRRVWEAQE